MYFVYVYLSKKDLNFYTGYTSDLKKRHKEHLAGKVPSTRNRLPICLIYYECCVNKYDAIKREKFLKSGQGKRYLKKRLKNFLQNIIKK
ncbi:MAG: GIY-YIG nuclease family protein [Patescibacteria group bacterium]